MRLALISDHASPLAWLGGADSGGQNVYVGQVARHLAEAGHEVDVFTRRDAEDLPDQVVLSERLRVIHVPAGPPRFVRKEELLPYMREFAQCVRGYAHEERYDLVHANFFMSALVASILKRWLEIPYVVTFHALGRVRKLHQGADDAFPAARLDIEDAIVAEADHIIAECPQDMADLLELYQADRSRLTIIPCGYDPEELQPIDRQCARQQLGWPLDELIVLQLGRLVPRKGIETVIRGLALLEQQHGVPARLMIVGGESREPDPQKTPEIGRLRGIVRELSLEDRVTFVGNRGRNELSAYYSAADVFVTTPWYEPFGITPLEAMACGVPVIGSAVGGIKMSVVDGETGYLVPPRNEAALADRLAMLLTNASLRERFGNSGLHRVARLFTWERVTAQIERLYHEVLQVNRGMGAARQRDRVHLPTG